VAGAFSSAFSSAFDVGAGGAFQPALAARANVVIGEGAAMFLKKNQASQVVYFGLVNASSGAAVTGATVSVRRSIDGTFAAATGTVTEDSGGLYKFTPSQADTNGDQVGYYFTATGAIPVCLNVRTTAADPSDAVRFGLTALPNAAAEASGGLVTRGTGTGQISVSSGQVILQSGTGTGQLDFTSGVVKANAVQLLGTAWLTPGTAGTPDVNVKLVNAVSTSSVTTVNANIGTTQPTNFTGTGASATVKADAINWAGSAITASSIPVGTAAGAAGGLFIAGTNAATTITTALTTTFTGDLTGKILGTGSGVITGAGANVNDHLGNNIAPAATALSTATWTGTRAGYLDNLSGGAVALASGVAVTSIGAGVITAASIASDAITAAKIADGAIDTATFASGTTIPRVTLADTVTTYTGNTPQTGDTYARFNTMIELDGAVYRYTVNALEQAPAGGGGGSTDWTADERTAIRTILGVPTSGTTPEVPSAGALKVIDDFLDTEIADIQARLPAALVGGRIDASVGAMAANTLTASALATDAVAEIQSGLSTLTAAQVNAECDTALADAGVTTTVTGRIDAAVTSRQATFTTSTGVTLPATVASTTNITAGTITTVTNLTNNNDKTGYTLLQSFPANFASLAITAGGVASADLQTVKTQAVTCAAGVTVLASVGTASASTAQTGDSYARLGAPAGASVAADVAAVKADTASLLARITSTLFSGITSLASWLGALAGKTADASTQTEIRATAAGASYTVTTDSLEAVRDRGDAAWTTGSGGGGGDCPTADEVAAAVVAALSGQSITVTSPLSADGTSLAIDRGLSYPSPAIRWNQNGADWPDLSGLTVTVTTDRGVVYSATPGGTDPDQTITLALTSAQSAAVPLGAATWEVSAADGGEAVLEFKVAVTAT